ncbi:MAG: hypothetical protein AAGB15_01830 [Pseudomonadota bacterium]
MSEISGKTEMTARYGDAALDLVPDPWQPVDRRAFWSAWFEAPFIAIVLALPVALAIAAVQDNWFLLLVPVFAIPVGAIPYFALGAPACWLAFRMAATPFHRILAAMLAGTLATFGSDLLMALLIFDRPGGIPYFRELGMIFASLWSFLPAIRYNAITARGTSNFLSVRQQGA